MAGGVANKDQDVCRAYTPNLATDGLISFCGSLSLASGGLLKTFFGLFNLE